MVYLPRSPVGPEEDRMFEELMESFLPVCPDGVDVDRARWRAASLLPEGVRQWRPLHEVRRALGAMAPALWAELRWEAEQEGRIFRLNGTEMLAVSF